MSDVMVGYDGGFVIASDRDQDLGISESPFQMKINGWGQLRHTIRAVDTSDIRPGDTAAHSLNQFQLKRARLIFSGTAFDPDFGYFIQLDGRSSSGDNMRLLDYFLTLDLGHHLWGLDRGVFGFKTGKYKMPFSMARYLSGREFEFTDRSMSSMYFDVNRSLAWGLYGQAGACSVPTHWEVALFNGFVTGGAETGSSGTLDGNFAYSARVYAFPTGEWGTSELADLEWHEFPASRIGIGLANSRINADGTTEFDSIRVVDSGKQLSGLLPDEIYEYSVSLCSLDAAFKLRGYSLTTEYYFRNINKFKGAPQDALFDHGFWLQLGKFVVPERLQLLTRWSRVVGESGTLGDHNQSADEIGCGFVWYVREQHGKFSFDASYVNGTPINSSALDMSPGFAGWLLRSQVQFAF